MTYSAVSHSVRSVRARIAKDHKFRDYLEVLCNSRCDTVFLLCINPLDISRIIKEFHVNLFDSIKWISPVDQKVLDKERLQMHDDIFYGRSNSLVD